MAAAGRASWGELLGRIGRSAVELWKAEYAALKAELGGSGRLLLHGVLLAAIAGFLGFWALGLLFVALVAALALVVPVWAAAAIVMAVAVLAAYLLWRAASARFSQVVWPGDTIQRRLADHVEWWQEQLLPPEDEGDGVEPGSLAAGPAAPEDAR